MTTLEKVLEVEFGLPQWRRACVPDEVLSCEYGGAVDVGTYAQDVLDFDPQNHLGYFGEFAAKWHVGDDLQKRGAGEPN